MHFLTSLSVISKFSYPLLLDENPTLGSRGYFFLIDTDGSRRIRVNEAQSAERKKELRTDEGVTNWRPSSDSELIARMEMRLLDCVTRGPSREPYRKHGLFHERTSGAAVCGP